MGKELPAMNNYTWHILFRVLTTTVQPGQDRVSKYSHCNLISGKYQASQIDYLRGSSSIYVSYKLVYSD